MAKMSRDEIKKLQEIIGTDVDGIWGPKSRAAYSAWLDNSSQPSEDTFVSPEGILQAGKTFSTNLGDEYRVAEELGDTKLDPNYGRDPNAKSGFDPDEFVAPQMDNLYDKSTRIAEIQRRLDEIRREKEKYDVEEKMGEYKFLYDADPSSYMAHWQNVRNNEQTNAIRKASENATKASQAQTAWRQLLIDEENAKYDAQSAQNRVDEAKQNGNAQAYSEAMTELSRIRAKIKRLNRDKDEYRNRFAEMLGVSREEMGEQPSADWNKESDTNYGKLNALENLGRDVETGLNDLRTRPASMKDKQKQSLIKTHGNNLAQYRDIYEKNKDVLGGSKQAEWDKKFAEYSDAIPKFKQSQSTTMTQEKFAKLNYAQLLKIGSSKALSDYKKNGFKNADLDKAIDRLTSQGK